MEKIVLQNTLPEVFAGRNEVVSDVWHRLLTFEKGKSYLIEAASGTGKTSLCSFLYGYRKDYQGIICFDTENVRNFSVARWDELRKRSLSMLFQELRLFPELTAWENVKLKNDLTGFQKRKRIEECFEVLGIADKLHAKVGKMSWGQQQRVAFIRALCQPFDFIFLDEPISHLDDENGRIMSDLLMEEVKAQGAGVMVTSIGKRLPLAYDIKLKL